MSWTYHYGHVSCHESLLGFFIEEHCVHLPPILTLENNTTVAEQLKIDVICLLCVLFVGYF